jgi:hypothetical protein
MIGQTSIISAQTVQTIGYNWEQKYYADLNGKRSLLFSKEMRLSKITFADLDGDGDKDIFLGQENGELAYFENQGNSSSPFYVLITQAYKAVFEQPRQGQKVKVWTKIDVGRRSAPTMIDIDADGDLDLFVGSEEGNIWFFENQGNNLIPVFQLSTTKYQNLLPGKNSTLLFADINLQRKYDLLIGTADGRIMLYINEGTRQKAHFPPDRGIKIVQFGLETNAVPALLDWDKDGDLDLIVGQNNGTLSLFLNQGDRFFPDWQFTERNFQLIDIGGESAPLFVDMNGNGEQDLIIGSANPTVFHYESKSQYERRIFWNRSTNIFNFNKLIVTGHRASMTAGDLDGDGDLDLIVGEEAGNLNYFENDGDARNPNWILKTEELIFMTGQKNSAPTLGDLDGDEDLDLLVGAKTGQIAYVINSGTTQKPKWELKDRTFFQIDVGSNSVPRLYDNDKDGDLDLFIGNYSGRIIAYKNKGTKKEPLFVLDSTRFTSINTKSDLVPMFFDWNRDKVDDLIIGNVSGKIQLLVAPSAEDPNRKEWELDKEALTEFNVGKLSHPVMLDMDGDNVKDLLIGNNKGDFLLFLNKGRKKKEATTQVPIDNSIDRVDGSLVIKQADGDVNLDPGNDDLNKIAKKGDEIAAVEDEEFEVDKPPPVNIDPKFVRDMEPLVANSSIVWSRPTLGDLDQDGDLDLIIGSKSGRVYLYENQGSRTEWSFRLTTSNLLHTDRLQYTSPLLTDMDEDGDLDLIVGSKIGKLRFYENQGNGEKENFVYDDGVFHSFWLGGNAKAGVADLDNDGIKDLLVGNIWGRLVYLHNASDHFEVIRRDYENIDVGINSTPVFVDINNSGTVELMIGSDSGKIVFYQNTRKDLSGQWKLISDYTLEVGFKGTSPSAFDLDGDGDLDLITGSENGQVILYRNKAILNKADGSTDEPTPEGEEAKTQ